MADEPVWYRHSVNDRPSSPWTRPFPMNRGLGSYFRINRIVPALFVGTFFLAIFMIMAESPNREQVEVIKYSTVTGYFLQDEPSTDPNGFDYSTTSLGLIDRSYDTDTEFDPDHKKTQWDRFNYKLSQLNSKSDSNVQYKLFYMGRHGEGYHNQAETYYGTAGWDCYWSLKEGNGTTTWADAHLASTGEAQARKANAFWASQIATQNIPTPEKYYVSPLVRCLETAKITFSGLSLPPSRPFDPLIKELFREGISAHTCDRRSTKTQIHDQFPDWKFEDGFVENDPFWKEGFSETQEEEFRRTKVAFDDVFKSDKSTYISVTSHSGQINMSLRVLGHRPFSLSTGQVIPILVKAETVIDSPPPPLKGPAYVPVTACSDIPPLPTAK